MSENSDFTLMDLLEQANNDPSWEPDADKRAALTQGLAFQATML